MMRKPLLHILTFVVTLSSVVIASNPLVSNAFVKNTPDDQLTSRELIMQMLNAIDKVKTLKYNFKGKERIKGETMVTDLDVKLNVKPFKVYLFTNSDFNKDAEIIYIEGQNNGKARVNPAKFLIPNLSLSPYGGQMRKKQHNTILQSGFNTLSKIVKSAIKKADIEAPGEFEKYVTKSGEVTWDGKHCYKVIIEDPTFGYSNYTLKEGEDINTLSQRKNICGYLILEKNENVNSFDDLEEGVTVKIPSSYAKRTVLYIDKANLLPIVQIMYDEVGQFERYEFHDLQINPVIKDEEFTEDYEAYDF